MSGGIRITPSYSLELAEARARQGITRIPKFPRDLVTELGIRAARDFYVTRCAEELARLELFLIRYPLGAYEIPGRILWKDFLDS